MCCLRLCLLCSAILFAVCAPPATAQQLPANDQVKHPLANADVVLMAKAKFGDQVIVKEIQANDTDFDVSVGALIDLKKNGVSQQVIEAMISASSKVHAVSAPSESHENSASPSGLPDEVGVYLRQNGELVTINPEIVNWRTGGVLKHTLTLGLDKGHVNGSVAGPQSPLTVSQVPLGMGGPLEFFIRCPEGDSASEYQLLRFWTKNNRREFRTITGGILHSSGGAQDNVVEFKFEKVAPYVYKIALKDLGPGEYGFLAPGALASANVASEGKVYTFRISE